MLSRRTIIGLLFAILIFVPSVGSCSSETENSKPEQSVQSVSEITILQEQLKDIHFDASEPAADEEIGEAALVIERLQPYIDDNLDAIGCETLLKIAHVKMWQRNYLEAKKYYGKVIQLYKQHPDNESIAQALIGLGTIQYMSDKSDSAKEYFQKALLLSKEIAYKYGQAIALVNIGVIEEKNGNPNIALENYQHSLSISKAIGHKYAQIVALGDLGIFYKNNGNLDIALEFFLQALGIHEQMGESKLHAGTLGFIGITYQEMGNLDIAREYLQASDAMYKKCGSGGRFHEIVQEKLSELDQ